MRKYSFREGDFFHIFNKSISSFGIFANPKNAFRFIQTISYYNSVIRKINLGNFLKNNDDFYINPLLPQSNSVVKFLSYCIMPDHYHLLIKILKDHLLSHYINNVENSFSRFFNLKFNRKGPLWQSRFKAVRITSDKLLLHVSRYIHLNPTSSSLVNNPEEWQFSSYRPIINEKKYLLKILTEFSIKNNRIYQKFVEDNQPYQHKLKIIKKAFLDY